MATKNVCEIPGCGKRRVGHGLCQQHYMQERRKQAPPCSIEGCDKPTERQGLCNKHLMSLTRYGDPLALKSTSKGAAVAFVQKALAYNGDECLFWPFARDPGGRAQMTRDGVHMMVHPYVCELINGPKPSPAHEACHSCGHGHLGCITPAHLRWGTRQDNANDMVNHGTSLRGNKHPLCKLSESQVREIRAMEGTVSRTKIARIFGVSPALVSKIHRRKSWAWLD